MAAADTAEILTKRAAALLALGRAEQAGNVAGKALAIDPEFAPAHLALARSHHAAGRLDDAHVAVSTALSLDPTVNALHVASMIARSRSDFDEALALLDRAVALEPEIASLHVGRALALIGPHLENTTGRSDAGIAQVGSARAAEKAAELDPELASPHFALALVALSRADLTGAAAHLSTCLRRDPEWADAHLLIGEVRARQGMGRLASRHLAEAGRLDPDNGAALGGLRRLNGFRDRLLRRKGGPSINPFLVAEARHALATDGEARGQGRRA